MLVNTAHLKGLAIHARDGALGTVEDFYFDDDTWGVRYFVVDTGGLAGRKVLISPMSVIRTDWQDKRMDLALSQEQVKNSPDIDTHKPVSRQHEAEYLGYYGYPYYWGGPYLWGDVLYPAGLAVPATGLSENAAMSLPAETEETHLHSCDAVCGFHLDALDGELGHLDCFLVDDQAWAIRYAVVATRNWWPGKKVLVSPAWVESISWPESKVFVGLKQDAIRGAPEYDESLPVTREYEHRLYLHYGRPPYWAGQPEREYAHTGA